MNPAMTPPASAGEGPANLVAQEIVFAWIRSEAFGTGLKMMLGRDQVAPLIKAVASVLESLRAERDEAERRAKAAEAEVSQLTRELCIKLVPEAPERSAIVDRVTQWVNGYRGGDTTAEEIASATIQAAHNAGWRPVWGTAAGLLTGDQDRDGG